MEKNYIIKLLIDKILYKKWICERIIGQIIMEWMHPIGCWVGHNSTNRKKTMKITECDIKYVKTRIEKKSVRRIEREIAWPEAIMMMINLACKHCLL